MAACAFLISACSGDSQRVEGEVSVEPSDAKVFQIGITRGLSRIPWEVAKRSDLISDIEQEHGLRLELISFANEADAVLAYSAGQIDGVTSTLNTMVGTLQGNAADSNLILLTDFSQSSHALLSKTIDQVKGLSGTPIHVQLNTASHYFLFRALENIGLSLSDVELIDVSILELQEGAIDGSIETMAVGAPLLGQLRPLTEFKPIATSEMLFGEMIGGLAVSAPVLANNPSLGSALIKVWFAAVEEIMADDGTFTRSGTATMAELVGLSPRLAESLLSPKDIIADPEHALELLDGTNLEATVAGGQRFRSAADAASSELDLLACVFECDGDVIHNGAGTQLRLDAQYLDAFVNGSNRDRE